MNLERMDLRKARCLVLKESDDSIRNLHVSTGPTLVIDCPPYTMYFVMSSARETKVCLSQLHVILTLLNNNIFLYFFLSLSRRFYLFCCFSAVFPYQPTVLSFQPTVLPSKPTLVSTSFYLLACRRSGGISSKRWHTTTDRH